ncbi:SecDF P1 head subdomain-containing protein [Cryptosporangium sp. NPDC051539]|uniref:SecDF P1 head subdomain-containing protein n=1 Tax=Cryptosporangium sp. NPDC051539 TaxID=3363962 RepID=UPI0037BD8FA3
MDQRTIAPPAPERDPSDHLIGPQPGSNKQTVVVIAVVSVVVMVLAMVTIILAGLSFLRSNEPVPAEPAARSYTGSLAVPLRIVPVVGVTKESCSDGSTRGRTGECYTLGTGGMTVVVLERLSTGIENDAWVLQVRFSSADTVALRALTSTNVGKQVALVVNGTVLMAPNVASPITGGELQIAGNFTKNDVDAIFTELTKR